MKKSFACLILLGVAMVLSGCVERHYRPYYHDRDGYYGGDRYGEHHYRRYDDGGHHHDDRQ